MNLFTSLLCFTLAFAAYAEAADKPERREIVIDSVIQAPGILVDANKVLKWASSGDTADIYLMINSPGGGVFAGMQFINAMEAAKAAGIKFKCYVPGMAASMAFQFLVHCNERYAFRYSMLLWHPVRVSGMQLLTPSSAAYLAWSLQELEERMLGPLKAALDLDDDEFFLHYANETMWTAEGLTKISDDFISIVDEMPFNLSKLWHVSRMRYKHAGQVTWEEFEIGGDAPEPTPAPTAPPATDCESCHVKHGRK